MPGSEGVVATAPPGRLLAVGLLALCLVAGGAPAALGQDLEQRDPASVVVTTEVLGSVVNELVGDVADVTTLMPPGVDPHSWEPSARDTQAIFAADLVVANGLDLEEGLLDVLDQAVADGVTVFHATDHVQVRMLEAGAATHDGADQPSADDEHGVADPHFWLDPLAMRDAVVALAAALREVGIDVGDREAQLTAELVALDAEVASILSVVPADERKLVTGHDSLGYFADRYGFEVVGTVIPGQTSTLEPSAHDIADLIKVIRAEGVTAVFADVGTPQSVARSVADETGAQIVELQPAQLPEGGTYEDMMRQLATDIATALTS